MSSVPITGENNPSGILPAPPAPPELANDPETLIRTSWVHVSDGIRGQGPAAQQTLIKLQDLFLAKKNKTMSAEEVNQAIKSIKEYDILQYCDSVSQMSMNKVAESIINMEP